MVGSSSTGLDQFRNEYLYRNFFPVAHQSLEDVFARNHAAEGSPTQGASMESAAEQVMGRATSSYHVDGESHAAVGYLQHAPADRSPAYLRSRRASNVANLHQANSNDHFHSQRLFDNNYYPPEWRDSEVPQERVYQPDLFDGPIAGPSNAPSV